MGKVLKVRFLRVMIMVVAICVCNAWSGEAAERQNVDQKLEDYVGQLEVSIITKQHKDFIMKEIDEVGTVVLGFHSKPAAEIVSEVFTDEKKEVICKILEKVELSKYPKLSYLDSPEVEIQKFVLIMAQNNQVLRDLLI